MQGADEGMKEGVLFEDLLDRIGELKRLGTDSVLQGEILIHLAAGKTTAHELAAKMLSEGDSAPTRAQYMRVVRALRTLQGKGYVAKALFGKEKPYRLTRHGEEMMTALATNRQTRRLVTNRCLVLYGASALLVAASYLLTWMRANSIILIASWFVTGVVSGLTLSRFIGIVRRIS